MKVGRYDVGEWLKGGRPDGKPIDWSLRVERGRAQERNERKKRNVFGTVVVLTFNFRQPIEVQFCRITS
jgi:hypothetical protein